MLPGTQIAIVNYLQSAYFGLLLAGLNWEGAWPQVVISTWMVQTCFVTKITYLQRSLQQICVVINNPSQDYDRKYEIEGLS